jgi:hypothetical protein
MAKLTKPARDRITATKFAFPKQRKEPLENASHVRNAVARFRQVKDVTEAERRAQIFHLNPLPLLDNRKMPSSEGSSFSNTALRSQ